MTSSDCCIDPALKSLRSLTNALREIALMTERINLPRTIVARTNALMAQVHYRKNLKGAYDATAAACLYIACRQEGVPTTFKEICAVSKSSTKEIGRCFKLVLKAFGTDMMSSLSSTLGSTLGLSNVIKKAAKHIARQAVETDIVPLTPPLPIMAAAMYMASQASEDKRSRKEIADIAGVADVIMRELYELMYPHAVKLFPEDFEFVTPIDQLPQM